MKSVSVDRLVKMGACRYAVRKIRKKFPKRIPITKASLDWFEGEDDIEYVNWFVERLPEKHPIRVAYEKGMKKTKSVKCLLGYDNKRCEECVPAAVARRVLLAAARKKG